MRRDARQIARAIRGSEIVGDPEAFVYGARSVEHAGPHALSWLRVGRPLSTRFEGSILLCGPGEDWEPGPKQARIACPNPRLGLGYALLELYPDPPSGRAAIPPSAAVHPTAVIGEMGISLEWDDHFGRWLHLPHVASVYVGERVRIDPLVTVMCGFLEDTVLEEGCVIANHANVGHGAHIGRHAVIGPHASIGGSAKIGLRATVWQGAMVRNGVTVGDGAVIGQGANVVCDVPAGETWVGNPAERILERILHAR